jgi:NADH-quinone oxidoreductase subunit L
MLDLIWLIPLIMFGAALINGLGARKLGALAGHIAWISMAICCAISFLILKAVMDAAHADAHWHGHTVVLWEWFKINNLFGPNRTLSIDMAFRVDQLTAIFLCFVSFIGTLVFIYATGYMKEKHNGKLELDPGYARFFSYVSLFAASMFVLVLAANMVVMFIGWEGVGLCSYLLIGYFFDKGFSENLSCADAGRKAFVVNRIGDAGLIVGMGMIFERLWPQEDTASSDSD